MEIVAKNEWLAELLQSRHELVTRYWIDEIRTRHIPGYDAVTDERLREELPPTVDSMIYALQTGDTEGPRMHSVSVIQRRLADGLLLPDLQMSLHALATAVMRVVDEAGVDTTKRFEALQSASTLYYVVALIAAAVYEQLRAEQQRRFATAYDLGTTLSRTLDRNTILETAAEKVAGYVGASSVAVLLLSQNGEGQEVQASHNLGADVTRALPDICEFVGCPSSDEDDSERLAPPFAASDVRAHERLDRWSGLLASQRCLSLVCAPLMAKRKRVGTLVVLWPDVHATSEAEMDYLLALAGHIANAVHNADLYEEAKGKRELGVLLDASRLFASSLNMNDILDKIARMAAEAIGADVAVVLTLDRPRSGSGSIAHYASGRRAKRAMQHILEAVVPEWEASALSSLGRNFARGKPVLLSKQEQFPDKLQSLAGVVSSGLAVPLMRKGRLLGAFALACLEPDGFTEDDLPLATGLADLAVVAIENAGLYEYERNIAESLQKGFLPASLPTVHGYELAAYYRAAMAEAGIGGDFYDIFTPATGGISVTIGDVSGKGLRAAVPTAIARYTIRAYAAEDKSPGSVLSRLNRALREGAADDQFITAFYGSLDPRKHRFTYAAAGHNPPLLYSASSGQVAELATGGLCLGVAGEVEYADQVARLQPGDALLLYTDGATDVKQDGSRLEIEGLAELLASSADGSAEEIVAKVSDGILRYGRGMLPDDVALVVLKRLETSKARTNSHEG